MLYRNGFFDRIYKLRNIEEREAARKLLQERRSWAGQNQKLTSLLVTVLISSCEAGIMPKNLEEDIPSCSRTEAHRMTVLAPNQPIQAMMQREVGKRQPKSLC